MDKKQLCPVCKKPVVGNHPGANVYHVRCVEREIKDSEGYRANSESKKACLDAQKEG